MPARDARTGLTVAIVPALDEEHSIVDVVKGAAKHADHVIVIDDGSTDATSRLAAEAGARVVSHPRNLGVGAAVATGLAAAAELGADAVVQVDGDGQHDASFIPDLVAPLAAGADLVVGSRFEHGFEMSWVRRSVLAVFARLISRRLGTRLADPTSGFRAFGPRAIETLPPVFPLKYLSDTVEVLYLAADHGLTVETVPVAMVARKGGKPYAGPVQSVGYAVRMLGIVARYTFAHRRRVAATAGEQA